MTLRDALASALDVLGMDVRPQRAADPLDCLERWAATPREMAEDILSDPAFREELVTVLAESFRGSSLDFVLDGKRVSAKIDMDTTWDGARAIVARMLGDGA